MWVCVCDAVNFCQTPEDRWVAGFTVSDKPPRTAVGDEMLLGDGTFHREAYAFSALDLRYAALMNHDLHDSKTQPAHALAHQV
jgi:hypothetical protein